jgi:hypothetical protein
MKAEAEAVTVSDGNTGGSGSGGDKDNGGDSHVRCTDKNNQGCGFFDSKTNTQIHERTFRNNFFRMVSFVFSGNAS